MIGLLLFTMFACEENDACTEVGCMSGLTVTFLGPDGEDVSGLQGQVTIGSRSISFDCSVEGEEYLCEDNEVFFFAEEGESFSYDISVNAGPYMGQGQEAIAWEESTPNGEECPPVCYAGSIEVYLDRNSEPQ